jgi:hypothetical protein
MSERCGWPQPLLGGRHILRRRLSLDEPSQAELLHGDPVREARQGLDLAVVAGFDELGDVDVQAGTGGPQGQPQGGGGFALAVAGINLNVSGFVNVI